MDYHNTPFEKTSPTIAIETFFMQLCVAQQSKLILESFDVPGAYLHATLGADKRHVMRIDVDMARLLIAVDTGAAWNSLGGSKILCQYIKTILLLLRRHI